MDMQLGCMNRPWWKLTLEETLTSIAGAGFSMVEFCAQQGKHLIRPDSTDEELDQVRQALDAAGLTFDMISTGVDFNAPVARAVAEYEKIIAGIARLGGKYLMSCGVMDESLYDKYYQIQREASDIAAGYGIELHLKPHGGVGATSDGLLAALDRVDRPNFGISYDPGNILYYTGLPPEDDLPKIADRISSLCIKDSSGGKHGEVDITPGTGDVNFDTIFTILRDANFAGPGWLECVGGSTPAEIDVEARKAKAFIEGVLARL